MRQFYICLESVNFVNIYWSVLNREKYVYFTGYYKQKIYENRNVFISCAHPIDTSINYVNEIQMHKKVMKHFSEDIPGIPYPYESFTTFINNMRYQLFALVLCLSYLASAQHVNIPFDKAIIKEDFSIGNQHFAQRYNANEVLYLDQDKYHNNNEIYL